MWPAHERTTLRRKLDLVDTVNMYNIKTFTSLRDTVAAVTPTCAAIQLGFLKRAGHQRFPASSLLLICPDMRKQLLRAPCLSAVPAMMDAILFRAERQSEYFLP